MSTPPALAGDDATFLDAQNRALEMVVTGAPLNDILAHLATTVEASSRGGAVASILLLDMEGRLHSGASPSLPDHYVQAIDGLPAALGVGTCCHAAASASVVLTPDIEHDAGWQQLKALPLALGLVAAWSQPIISRDGRVLGTFGTYFRECRQPTAAERRAVEILSRTAALAIERAQTEAQLRASEARHRELASSLLEADRRKDEFLATLAHELRNPLAPIQQAVAVARSPRATAAQTDWALGVIARQAQHMTLLLRDLLDVSRITSGKLELRREWVRLASVVDTAVETARPAIESREHRLELRLEDAALDVHADPLRLAQVLSNLLTNAAKYSERGSRIALESRTRGGFIELSVADTGIGIEAGMLEKVFEMFCQVDNRIDRSEGGLGIGLALVRGLVQLHGGQIEARSEGTGRGSTFLVRLPIGPRPAPEVDGPRGEAEQPQRARRILVVDDNVDAAQSLALLLRLQGHDVRCSHGGIEALQEATERPPEVCLLDIGMPQMSGHELAAHLRERLGDAVTLVAVSGWGQLQDRERAREAGFDHHLTKPVDLEALRGCLEAVAPASPAARGASLVG